MEATVASGRVVSGASEDSGALLSVSSAVALGLVSAHVGFNSAQLNSGQHNSAQLSITRGDSVRYPRIHASPFHWPLECGLCSLYVHQSMIPDPMTITVTSSESRSSLSSTRGVRAAFLPFVSFLPFLGLKGSTEPKAGSANSPSSSSPPPPSSHSSPSPSSHSSPSPSSSSLDVSTLPFAFTLDTNISDFLALVGCGWRRWGIRLPRHAVNSAALHSLSLL
ncbi:hypothetical protein GGI43DRAFT_413254 [Trichoderma evansii]